MAYVKLKITNLKFSTTLLLLRLQSDSTIQFEITYSVSQPILFSDTSVGVIWHSTWCLSDLNSILFPSNGSWKLNWSFAKPAKKSKHKLLINRRLEVEFTLFLLKLPDIFDVYKATYLSHVQRPWYPLQDYHKWAQCCIQLGLQMKMIGS